MFIHTCMNQFSESSKRNTKAFVGVSGGHFVSCFANRQMNSLGERCLEGRRVKESFVLVNFLTCNLKHLVVFFKNLSEDNVYSRTPQDRTRILLISAVFKSFIFSCFKRETEKITLQRHILHPHS